MRAFVEVDPTVGLACLEAGLELRRRFRHCCKIQLVVFAQDAMLYADDPALEASMAQLLEKACEMSSAEHAVLGSTPYVESTDENQRQNIRMLFDLADKHNRDVDFHLDYNLDQSSTPLVWFVLEEAHRRRWKLLITIGHATRLGAFNDGQWDRLAQACHGLDVAFVALPHSDLYMQGRTIAYKERSRATLPLLELQSRGIPCALAVK